MEAGWKDSEAQNAKQLGGQRGGRRGVIGDATTNPSELNIHGRL
jgi:hypothetical protein